MPRPRQLRLKLRNGRVVLEVLSSLRAHWQSWNQITQHWLKNIVIGAGIEWILIPLLHLWVPVLLITVENLALDRMMAITAIIGGPPRAGRSPPRQIFVNVDDVTWRGKDWGGGEPDRAPRTAVLELVKTAFSHEATQVVVDIVIKEITRHIRSSRRRTRSLRKNWIS